MKIREVRLNQFKSFGSQASPIHLDNLSFLIGANGSGKTVVLEALCRLFGVNFEQRRVKSSDFHVPLNESSKPSERKLWIECDMVFPELVDDILGQATIPPNFKHMRLEDDTGEAIVRYRLEATLYSDGEIEEQLLYVLEVNSDGTPAKTKTASRLDRTSIHVHYLPARRDPKDHIAFTTKSLLGRVLRAADWEATKESVSTFTTGISETLSANGAVSELSKHVQTQWKSLHSGNFFSDPALNFDGSDLESVMKLLTLSFAPGHGEDAVDFSRLSDGEKSLLYVTLVLSIQQLGRGVLAGQVSGFDRVKLGPPVFTLIAIEEPENSLSPHYLGRVVEALQVALKGSEPEAECSDLQAVIATHSPAILTRAKPEAVRHLRLNEQRQSLATRIQLPAAGHEALKFIRSGVLAFPELYFARLVVFGEGDSEQIVLSRLFQAHGIGPDQAGISVVPLGGRHVNHFWRLLAALKIPYVTLLDLDLARFGGGWGRLKYATKELRAHAGDVICSEAAVKGFPKWNASEGVLLPSGIKWMNWLEGNSVYYSSPLDLDFTMMEAFPEAYEINEFDKETPTPNLISSVLGKSHGDETQYSEEQLKLFGKYHELFKIGSKPAAHLNALSKLSDDELREGTPSSLKRMIDKVKQTLESLPE